MDEIENILEYRLLRWQGEPVEDLSREDLLRIIAILNYQLDK